LLKKTYSDPSGASAGCATRQALFAKECAGEASRPAADCESCDAEQPMTLQTSSNSPQ
jgi:hypothetical protein